MFPLCVFSTHGRESEREKETIEEARSYKRAMEMDDEQSLDLFLFIFIDLPCVHFNAFYWIKQSKELSCL